MHLSPDILGRADILKLDFGNVSPDAASNTISWLIEEFYHKRSHELAVAISKHIGDRNLVSVISANQPPFSLSTDRPQSLMLPWVGSGFDILGQQPLNSLVQEARTLFPEARVEVGAGDGDTDILSSHDKLLLELASHFPWYRRILNLAPVPFNGHALTETCIKLSMPKPNHVKH